MPFSEEAKTLLVIPSDPIREYEKNGCSHWLKDYYNPGGFFDNVYALSPIETQHQRFAYGMDIRCVGYENFSKEIKKIAPDVIRAYGGYWPADLIAFTRPFDIPVVVSVHDTNNDKIHESLRFADMVICMTRAVKNCVLDIGVSPERVRILPNRIDMSIFRPILKHQARDYIKNNFNLPEGKLILHVGRKSKQKNLETLIKALIFLPTDYFAVFIGRGDCRAYKDLAKQLKVHDRCFWIESIPNDKLPYWYSFCDCLCTPSRWEGFGIVFIEALACGTPIVTSDITPLNEYLIHESNAELVRNFEVPEDIARSIRKVCDNDKYRKALSHNAILSSQKYSKEKIDEQEILLYKEIVRMTPLSKLEIYKCWLWRLKHLSLKGVRKIKKLFGKVLNRNVHGKPFAHKKTLIPLSGEEWNKVLLNGQNIEAFSQKIRAEMYSPWGEVVLEETEGLDTILEIGSGSGEISLNMAKRGQSITCLDVSAESLHFVETVAHKLMLDVAIKQGDVRTSFPFDNSRFDCVWSSGLLEHFSFEEQVHILKESARVSKRYVIALVPNACCMLYRIGKDIQEAEGSWLYGVEEPIVSLAKQFQSAGIYLEREYTVGAFHAINFIPKKHPIRKYLDEWLKMQNEEELNASRQGYLLVSIGSLAACRE